AAGDRFVQPQVAVLSDPATRTNGRAVATPQPLRPHAEEHRSKASTQASAGPSRCGASRSMRAYAVAVLILRDARTRLRPLRHRFSTRAPQDEDGDRARGPISRFQTARVVAFPNPSSIDTRRSQYCSYDVVTRRAESRANAGQGREIRP